MMPVEVIMPKVDMDMVSGRIALWHVKAGQPVSKGDPLFDIETDKAAMEVEAPGDGILHDPAPTGTEIAIGQPVGWLYGKDEARPENNKKQRATPKARKQARDRGIDLADIQGSGPNGRIQAADILTCTDSVKVETGGLAVFNLQEGDQTPLVLIHGFAGDSSVWKPLAKVFKNRPVIAIDLPGHGDSPKLKINSFQDLARGVTDQLNRLELDRFHLVGHSLGGAIALSYADTGPGTLESLTLLAPAGLGPEVNAPVLEGICRATRKESLMPWLKPLVADETLITDQFAQLSMAKRLDPDLRAVQSAMADQLFPDGVQAFDLRAALQRLDLPARIIWGKQDAIIPWNHALQANGKTALHLLANTGHMPQIEQTAMISDIIQSSL